MPLRTATGGWIHWSHWNWTIKLLPTLEDQALFAAADLTQPAMRGSVFQDVLFRTPAVFLCPSNPYNSTASQYFNESTGTRRIGECDYASNAGDHACGGDFGEGADPALGDPPTYPACANTFPQNKYPEGKAAIRGVIGRFGWAASFRQITDGTSKTFALGECIGQFSINQNFGTQSWALTSHPMNWQNDQFVGKENNWPSESNPQWSLGLVFRSLHAGGGAQFALCDASVRFLSENINHAVYMALSSRAAGEAASVSLE